MNSRTYSALLSQVDTEAPTAKFVENGLGGTPQRSYVEPGVYRFTLAGAFPPERTVFPRGTIQIRSAGYVDNVVAELSAAGDYVELTTRYNTEGGEGVDGFLGGYFFEVRVYDELPGDGLHNAGGGEIQPERG